MFASFRNPALIEMENRALDQKRVQEQVLEHDYQPEIALDPPMRGRNIQMTDYALELVLLGVLLYFLAPKLAFMFE